MKVWLPLLIALALSLALALAAASFRRTREPLCTMPGSVAGWNGRCTHDRDVVTKHWWLSSAKEMELRGSDGTVSPPTIGAILATRTLELMDALAAADRAAVDRVLPDLVQLSRDGAAVAPSDEQRVFFEEMAGGYEVAATFVDNGDFESAAKTSVKVLERLQKRYLPTGRASRMFY